MHRPSAIKFDEIGKHFQHTEAIVDGNATELFAGSAGAGEVSMLKIGENVEPDLIRQTLPLGELPFLNTWCLNNE